MVIRGKNEPAGGEVAERANEWPRGGERRRKPRFLERVKVLDAKVGFCSWCGRNNLVVVLTPLGVISRCLSCRFERVVSVEGAVSLGDQGGMMEALGTLSQEGEGAGPRGESSLAG